MNNSLNYVPNERLWPKVSKLAWELNTDNYSPNVRFNEFAIRSYNNSSFSEEYQNNVSSELNKKLEYVPFYPSYVDAITLVSLGLGIWWAAGGPIWAGLLSIIGDELDGRLARATGKTSKRGNFLDWGTDITLTTASLMRLGTTIKQPWIPIVAAPIFLLVQAHLKSNDYRPPVGSARAVIMLTTMIAETSRC